MTIMRFVRILAAATVLLAPIGTAPRALAQTAPSPDALAAANELFSIMSKDMIGQMSRQLVAQFWPLIANQLQGKVDAKTLGDLRQEFERIQLENLGEAIKDAPVIYARHFTAAELHELAAFYRSPIGEKALRELPQVMSEFTQGLLPRMQAIQVKTQESFAKILRDRGYVK